jgi:hypothetical protein
MNLSTMQSMLGQIYDTPIRYPVDEFLLTRRSNLPGEALAADEQLLIEADGDTVYVSLYVDAQVLARLKSRTGEAWRLGTDNLADWLTAFEGVSHFQYLTYHASFDRPVSLLELELQAEVDKYAACLTLVSRQWPGRFPREVLPQLFSRRYRPDPALPPQAIARYEAATRGAARYCRELERELDAGKNWRAFLRSLRRFYRWPLSRKLELISA